MTGLMRRRWWLLGGILAVLVWASVIARPLVITPAGPPEVSAATRATQTAAPTPLNYWYGMTQIAVVGTIAAEHCGEQYFGTQCEPKR